MLFESDTRRKLPSMDKKADKDITVTNQFGWEEENASCFNSTRYQRPAFDWHCAV